MGQKTLSVSLEADRNYVRALGVLAGERGITIGKLTRDAIDKVYGTELKPIVLFFEQSGLSKHHSNDKNTKKKGAES